MEIILLEKVVGLGDVGALVKVKDGFARNYLIPKKKVLRATEANKEFFECKKNELYEANLEKKRLAEVVAKVIENKYFSIVRQASEDGKLYGSVNSRDIVKAFNMVAGVTVSEDMIVVREKIKEIGVYSIIVSLHPDVSVDVQINVARTEQEAAAVEKEHLDLMQKESVEKNTEIMI